MFTFSIKGHVKTTLIGSQVQQIEQQSGQGQHGNALSKCVKIQAGPWEKYTFL